MFQKIKQNIVPIITLIMVTLSAVIIVCMLRPGTTKAQDSFQATASENSLNGQSVTVHVGNYTNPTFVDKDGKKVRVPSDYILNIASANLTWDGSTYAAYCIQPTEPSSSSHSVTGTISPFSGPGKIAWLIMQDPRTFNASKQQAIRFAIRGGIPASWKNVARAKVGDKNTMERMYSSAQGSYSDRNLSDLCRSLSGTYISGSSATTANVNGTLYRAQAYIRNSSGASLKISNYIATDPIYVSNSQNGTPMELRTGTSIPWSMIYFWVPCSSNGSYTITCEAKQNNVYTPYSIICEGQNYAFAAPPKVRITFRGTWDSYQTEVRINKYGPTESIRLSGAVIEVTHSSTGRTERITMNSPSTTIKAVYGETLTIREISAPKNYEATQQTYQVQAKDNASVNIYNNPLKGRLSFSKQFVCSSIGTISDVNLSGLNFTLRSSDGSYEFTRNGDTFSIADVPYGTYTLYESGSYTRNGITVNVNQQVSTITIDSENKTLSAPITNEVPTGSFTLNKLASYDAAGYYPTNQAVAGATFRAYGNVNGAGEQLLSFSSSGNGSYTLAKYGSSDLVTGSSGRLLLTGIPIGTQIRLEEVSAPSGYGMSNKTSCTAMISTSGSPSDTIYNVLPRGSLAFYKKEAYTGKAITEARFVLKETQMGYVSSIVGSNGKYSGGTVPEFSTAQSRGTVLSVDSNGYCIVTNLPVGTYTIEEVTFPTNYKQSGTITPVTITANNTDSNPALIGGTNGVLNETSVGSISFSKKGTWNEIVASSEQYFTLIDVDTGKSVKLTGSNGSYSYDSSNYTASSFPSITQGNYTSHLSDGYLFNVNKSTGQATISGIPLNKIVNGKSVSYNYAIKEMSASAYYDVNSSDVSVTMLQNAATSSLTNQRKTGGYVSLSKTNTYTGDILAGAVFVIKSKAESDTTFGNRYVEVKSTGDGQYYFSTMGNANAGIVTANRITTGTLGSFSVSGLPFGSYTLYEIEAPKGYILSTKTFDFTITETNPAVSVTDTIEPAINYPLVNELSFTKQGNVDNDAIADCVFAIKLISSTIIPNSNVYMPVTQTSPGVYTLNTEAYIAKITEPQDNCKIRTDATGHCTVKNLPEGSYQIVELSVDNNGNYELLDPSKPQSGINYNINLFNESGNGGFKMIIAADNKSVQLDTVQSSTTGKTITNYRKTAVLTFYKKDSITHECNNLFTSCGFKLKLLDRNKYVILDGANGTYTYKSVTGKIENATTFNVNAQGLATFANLPIGTYEIYEITTDNDNLYKLTTDPVKVEVLNESATATMENIPWGGKITFIKKTDHGTLYPNCDEECTFYVQVSDGDYKDQYVVFDKMDDGSYQFNKFVQSKAEATSFTTNLEETLNGQVENAKAILFDLPEAQYTIYEASTGANYDIALAKAAVADVVLLRDNPDGEHVEMINHVHTSKTTLTKAMTEDKITINGLEMDVLPSGFTATVIGTSVTEANVAIKLTSNSEGQFVINDYTINGTTQTEFLNKAEFTLPIGTYKIAETNTGSHAKWGNHAHLDTIEKIASDGTTSLLWDRIADGGEEAINYDCLSSDEVTFKLTNIIDNPDLSLYKGVGAVRTGKEPEVVFIDTDVTYNISDFSNKYDTHAADITIVDTPEEGRDKDILALRKISIPGYNSIENGSAEIQFSIDVIDKEGNNLFSVPKQPLTAGVYSTKDLSPEIDSINPSSSGITHNVGKIIIKYYNFPARSSLIDDACINIRFRLSGALEDFVTGEKDANGKAIIKTFNAAEFTHSFLTDTATAKADIPIKKVNIHKIDLTKTISSIVNGVDYSKNTYQFTPTYPDFKFEVAGMLVNDNDMWESYINSYQVDTDQKVEIALPYGIYRLQEIHTNGYVDQEGFDIVCDSDGVFISPQNDSRNYTTLADATTVVGTPKVLNYKDFHIVMDEQGLRFLLSLDSTDGTVKPEGMSPATVLSEKNFNKKVKFDVENQIATGTLKLDKITTVLGGENAPQLAKSGYNVRFEGTSYAGVELCFELVSDKNGIFVPKTAISGYDAANSTYQVPEGKYTLTEYNLPSAVVLDNINWNGQTQWTRETDIDDPSTTEVSTVVDLKKDYENTGVLTNTTNTKILDEYESTNLAFNKVFLKNGRPASTDDFDKLALDSLEEYNFRVTLTHEDTGLVYNGLLSSTDGLVFYNLPFGKYKISESGEMYFHNVKYVMDNTTAHNVSIESDGINTYVTLSKIPNDPLAFAQITVENELEDFRGYSNVSSVANLISGEKNSTYSTLALTAKNYRGELLNSISVEIYDNNDLTTPLNFKTVNNQVFFSDEASDSTFTQIDLGDTGYIKIHDLPDGKYVIKQITGKEGYKPSRTYSPVTITKSEGGIDLVLYQSTSKQNP